LFADHLPKLQTIKRIKRQQSLWAFEDRVFHVEHSIFSPEFFPCIEPTFSSGFPNGRFVIKYARFRRKTGFFPRSAPLQIFYPCQSDTPCLDLF
jgi:hypothetical protein